MHPDGYPEQAAHQRACMRCPRGLLAHRPPRLHQSWRLPQKPPSDCCPIRMRPSSVILSSALPKPYRKLWGPESERVTVCICTPSFPQSSTTTSACPPKTAAPVSAVDEPVTPPSVGTKTVRPLVPP